jgi:hypothetical protein
MGVKEGQPARKADNLTAICEPIVYKIWQPRRLTNLWASRLVTGITLLFTFLLRISNINKIRPWILS